MRWTPLVRQLGWRVKRESRGSLRRVDARHRCWREPQVNRYILNFQILVVVDAGGHGGEGEHFPGSRSCSGSGGSGTVRRSRSSRCPRALLFVDLPGRPVAVRLMKAFLVVKVQPSGNSRPGSDRPVPAGSRGTRTLTAIATSIYFIKRTVAGGC